MSKSKGPSLDMVPLDNGFLVPRALHDELHGHAGRGVENLKYNKPYKAKDTLDPRYYASQDPWIVGRCVSHWERHGDLQLRFLGCPYCSVRYYERI